MSMSVGEFRRAVAYCEAKREFLRRAGWQAEA